MKGSNAAGGFSRRKIFENIALGGLAASAALASESTASAEPPAEEAVQPLPTFKYDLEAQTHWVGPGGSAKEATVAEFPISQSIAGVSMRLDAGAIRELHWHSLAAEWAYMIEGRCRITVIAPNGQAEVADFDVGDTWYFPRGHGHALQGLTDCHFLLGFDNGHFSEFGTFSITDWIARTPPAVVSRNLGVPASTLDRFPKKELYIGPGKVPPPISTLRNGYPQNAQFSHKYRLKASEPHVFPGGEERIASSVEFPIQTTLTAVLMDLKPGGLREMHWHPHADEWQYYVRGRARVGIFGSHGRARTEEFSKGHVAFIPQGFGHYVEQVGSEPTQILILFNSPYFQEIALSSWLGANPAGLLQDNFGMPQSVIDQLPTRSKGIVGAA
jgi:oxalate decarboxylase